VPAERLLKTHFNFLHSVIVSVVVLNLVVVAVGTVAKGLEKNLKKAGSNATVELLQKDALLGTCK